MNKEDNSTKIRIVDCAVQLYKERGYPNVSVSDICKSSGITRSAFYYHFKAKDEIIDNYLLIPEIYISENVLPILTASNYYEQFYQIFELFSKRIADIGPEIVGLVLKRNIDKNVHNLAPHDIAMWQVYVALIKKAQEAGEIENTSQAEKLVEAIIYMVDGIGIAWCNKKGSFDYVAECKRMMDALLLVR